MTEVMVGRCSDLADGDYRVVAVGELEVGVFRLGERFVAYENRCPHHGGPVYHGARSRQATAPHPLVERSSHATGVSGS